MMIYENYTILTPGPTKMSSYILGLGAKQVPYFRNKPFSDCVLASEKMLLNTVNAPDGSRVIFLTASGTAGMEATVINLLNADDEVLVVNGGTFGQRFCDLCREYDLSFDALDPQLKNLSDIATRVAPKSYSALLVNAHETSVGLLYDLDAIGYFCRQHNMLNIVDAISMFTTDRLDMQEQFIDALILSSQKGLALPPGLSMVILSPRALSRLKPVRGLYFNFSNYLKNGERGQTPYTPAVSIILQLHARLLQIKEEGGIQRLIEKARKCSSYFRGQITEFPISEFTEFPSNGLTALKMNDGCGAKSLVSYLEKEHKIIVCPNGGDLADSLFRVSHMGEVNCEDMDKLLKGLRNYFC